MFTSMRNEMFYNYDLAKKHFVSNPNELIGVEKFSTELINDLIKAYYDEFEIDYNEATYLYPFWANYPPDNRGRAPVGDQIPWIEVGEHAIGDKINRLISNRYLIREIGLPSGADNRFVLLSDKISKITNGYTNAAFIFLDIKSVGPRDNFNHTVISPYQVSGNGNWVSPNDNLINDPMLAVGHTACHTFYPAISPIYILSDGTIAPAIHIFVKPVYRMLSLVDGRKGQPLESIKNICVPNGLLLTENPNYLKQYPQLFFPGKDDKSKDPKKIRVRVSFNLLHDIDEWRIQDFKK